MLSVLRNLASTPVSTFSRAMMAGKPGSLSSGVFLFLLFFGLSLASGATAQTIFSEDFQDDSGSGSSTTTLTGDQWTSTETTSGASGTMSISSGAFIFAGSSSNVAHTCTWVSDAISIAGYTDIGISFSAYTSGGNSSMTLSMSNGSVSSSGSSFSFTPDPGATTTTVTFTFSVPKNKYRTVDNILVTGTSSCTPSTWYADADGDGLGNASLSTSACDQPSGYVADSTDNCDDNSACNYNDAGNPSCTFVTTWYADDDGDGYGDASDSQSACSAPSGYISDNTDCNDADDSITTATTTWYDDSDGDGLGDPGNSVVACSQPPGYVSNDTDSDPSLNPSDYTGTVLYPGDVYFSFAAEEFQLVQESYIGFTFLKDVAEGTKLVVSPSLAWSSSQWNIQDNSSATAGIQWTAIEWTAPSGGVAAGTEVILFDIQQDVVGGNAYCDGASSTIVRNSDNSALTGGHAAGVYVHLGPNNDYFTWNTPVSWLFQPDDAWDADATGSSANDGKCRHLHCVGYALDNAGNSGSGTIIEGSSWDSNLDPAYSFEDPLFYLSSAWKYDGGASLNAFAAGPNALVAQSLSAAVSFTAAGDAVPSYSSTSTADMNDYSDYDLIPFDPNGCISFASSVTWDNLVNDQGIVNPSGNSSLDITVDNGVSLIVDAGSEVACNDILVTTGAFQSCDGNGRIVAVSGDIALGTDATFEGGQGTLKLSALTAQTVDANNYADPTSANFRLKNLQVLNNKQVTLKGHVQMKPAGVLEFDSGAQTDKLKIDDAVASSLIFQSSGDGTAAIGPCSTSNFDDGGSQEFTFERYIPADPNGSTWVNIGAYVTGTTVGDWTSANANMLIFKYEESNYGTLSAGWSYLWDSSTVLSPGSGYMAMLPAGEDALISVTGAFKIGDVNVDLTFTDDPNQSDSDVDGWNLVSNPYPAPVNLAQVLSVAGISTWYVYDNVTADGYVAGGSDAPSTLGVGQSFWVKVNANTTLAFTEADKITTDNNTFVRELTNEYQGTVGVQITNGGFSKARAFVKFQEGTSMALNADHDALMFNTTGSNELRVWMESESGEKLSRQAAGGLNEVASMPLTVTTGAGGTLVFTEFTHPEQPENICVVVEDLETGEMAQMGLDSLVVEGLPGNTRLDDRFVLHLNGTPTMTWVSTACDGLVIDVEGTNWEAWNVSWEAEDGSQSGEGFPSDLENGAYTFVYDSPENSCIQNVAVTIETACLGDFNSNGERDVVDLLFILSGLPGGALGNEFAVEADCDCDGAVTINDMLTFLTVFATDCD